MTNSDLPSGKTCSDCIWFKSKCTWLLSRIGNEQECDWIPSKFKQVDVK